MLNFVIVCFTLMYSSPFIKMGDTQAHRKMFFIHVDDTKKYYSTSRFIATHINPANTILVLKNSRYTGVWCMVYQVYHRYLSKLKCTWKEPKPTKPLVKLKSFSGPIEQLFLIPSQDSPISGIQNIKHSTHSTAVYRYTAVQGKVYCLPIVPIYLL